MDITIIGGGIAGLYMSYRLLQSNPDMDIAIFEKSPSFGGKIDTQYDQNGNVMMEGGPWRILKEHSRLRQLCKDMDCRLLHIQKARTGYLGHPVQMNRTRHVPELSSFDVEVLRGGQTHALQVEASTGYNMSMDKSSALPISYPSSFHVPERGFRHLIDQLVSRLPKYRLHDSVMVLDVRRTVDGYTLLCQKRCHDNFVRFEHATKRVILACPPQFMTEWSIFPHLRHLVDCVETRSLNHMYCSFVSEPEELQDCYFKTDNILNQVISSNYGNKWCQVSYSSGRIADFWGRLFLTDPTRCRQTVQANVQEVFSLTRKPIIATVKNFYWQCAVHQWKPSFGFDVEKMFYIALYPHPIQLPRLHVIGEAFSRHQGWIEGALETVDMLLCHPKLSSPALPDEWVVFDDRVIDVKKWKKHHPGSEEAIMNHIFEDVTPLWRQIHSTPQSHQILLYNQSAWKTTSGRKKLFSFLGDDRLLTRKKIE